MVEPCAHPDGQIGSEPMMELMDQAMGELVASERVTADAATAATLPMWMRTPDEYTRLPSPTIRPWRCTS